MTQYTINSPSIEDETAYKIKFLITNGIALFPNLLCHFQGIIINNAEVAVNTHPKILNKSGSSILSE